MGTRETKHPAIPEPTDDNLLEVVRAIKESLEIGRKDRRGDVLDRWVTIRDLIDGQIITFYDESTVESGGVGPGGQPGGLTPGVPQGPPNPGSVFLQPFDPNKPRNLPPRPTNVHTEALWDSIMVKWDWPDVVAADNVDWFGAVIWVSATPVFTEGSFGGYSRSNFWVHENVGFCTNPAAVTGPGIRYYWVAWFAGPDPDQGTIEYPWGSIPGVGRQTDWTPYHYENGIKGRTSVDPGYVLDILQGEIRESHIYEALNQRINLIDYDEDGNYYSGSIQSRLLSATEGIADGVYGAIAETAGVRWVDGQLVGSYDVRIDLNGYIVGFGLSALADIDGLGTPGATSTFIVKADRFAVVMPGKAAQIPFVVGTVDGVPTVGIDGQLVVDGTITARHIEAGSIGAAEVNAVAIWAQMATFDQIYTGALKTNAYPAVRLEINGRGPSETFPLWFGWGQVGGTTIPGLQEPAFFFTNTGDLKLAGDLYVTGQGQFFVGNTDIGEWRLQLGSYDDFTLLYVGADNPIDLSDEGNWIFYIDKLGNAKFRGTVEAEFVSGEISRTTILRSNNGPGRDYTAQDSALRSIPLVTWLNVGEWMLPAPPFDSGHIPYGTFDISMFGAGCRAMEVRISFKIGAGPWQVLTEHVVDIYHYGGTRSASFISRSRVFGVSYVRLEMRVHDGSTGTSAFRNGIIMGIR